MKKTRDSLENQRFRVFKRLFQVIGLYMPYKGSNTVRPQYIFLRKFFGLFGLYPNIRGMHFYYENPNSFVAPKVYEYVNMMRMTELKNSDVILDLGCGEGTLTFSLAKSVKKAVGVDTHLPTIQDALFKSAELKNRVDTEFHCDKIENLGLPSESFNKVFSFSVIEHIPNYLEIFQELYRLLKQGGELIISVDSFSDFDPELVKIHQKEFLVQKYFKKEELRELLQEIGFKQVEIKPIFKSKFAKKWFIRVMMNSGENFDYFKRIYSFFLYYIISYHERKVKQNDSGIFLLAKCVK